MNYKETYQEWLSNPYFDEDTKKELTAIENDENEIKERFYADLAFGTAGLRGIIGAGINRMNIYVVRKATQGLADYILEQGTDKKRVAIAFDSRHMSPEFADEAARTLAANGIKAFIFESLRPTPELSFAVRHLDCIAGINVTASHNPPQYNGYKVYWEDGAQFTDPHASGVTAKVNAITDISTCKTMSKEDAVTAGLYEVIGKEVDDAYIAEVEKQVINQASIDEMASKLKIVYTPLHGTGNLPVRRVLDDLGFKDAKSGEYIPLTGNMSGSLLCEYVLSQKKEKAGSLPADGAVVKSIVTTNLVDEIAKAYNVKLIEVLTGFKWIGKEILGFEQSGKGTYLFGLEESYGCLIGTYARDKDAVSATVALCEAAAYYATKGKTLWDVMIDMYEKYGYCVDSITAMDFPGLEGMNKMKAMLANLRENPLKDIAGYKVLKIRDYSKDTVLDVESGKVEPTGLPSSDVLYYELESGAWVCVRPSGTEPKIKFYYGVKASSMDEAQVESAKFAEWAKAQA